MSRSNQTDSVNPCARWMEWNGEKGTIKYYDKEKAEKVELPFNLTFIMLDQLAVIKGWHDSSDSGIYSNEVKDITKEPLIVKSFKGGVLAQGFYKDIKDKIAASGGHFMANIYIAIKINGELKIASIQFKGAALNSWIEFSKKNRGELYKRAVKIDGVEEGTKGRVVFKTPVFKLTDISDDTNAIATDLDKELQEHLKNYFAKNTTIQVEDAPPSEEKSEPITYRREDHSPGKITPNRKEVVDIPYEPLPNEESYPTDDLPF